MYAAYSESMETGNFHPIPIPRCFLSFVYWSLTLSRYSVLSSRCFSFTIIIGSLVFPFHQSSKVFFLSSYYYLDTLVRWRPLYVFDF